MYISSRAALIRNLGIALLNGAITLIILLIAPLGLTAVIINTILIAVASFVNATVGDAVVNFLQPSQIKTLQAEIITQQSQVTKESKK
ncbi:MAG: CRISPR-associated protein Csx18 [Nostoc sp. DedQUE08]|uniref:CRISPR-associated protein Csx18 n=1 Tax=Nostoc sp. DedQUE08 TaxID=3075393 RepID=UPI002AD36BD1|nr:CRISPR-associated protein Csx18 [Nostoc sp. DedQUE08]MDZ8071152.1 CRISPR-associated protein Csx18 [Nostoc sp. DedQUE08]